MRDVEELSLGSEIEIDLEKTMGATARFFKLTLPHYIKGAGLRLNDLTSPEITDMPITRSTANTQEIKIMKAWERVDVINLTNMPIKQSTVKQLKEDQQKHGYKELTTMIADVLEKHYEKD